MIIVCLTIILLLTVHILSMLLLQYIILIINER